MIQCKLIELENGINKTTGERPKPGDMWFSPWMRHCASPEYQRDWADKREPLGVVLPNGDHFFIDGNCSGENHGWTVTGEAPNITVSPSIWFKYSRGYHGWLQNGILSDDLEGRQY